MVTFLSYFVIFNLSCKKYEFSLHLKWLTKNYFFAKKFYSLVFRREKYISFFMFKWVFWRCLQAVITLWGCERKYRLGWYLVDLPALPPARSGGGGGGSMDGSLVVRLAVGGWPPPPAVCMLRTVWLVRFSFGTLCCLPDPISGMVCSSTGPYMFKKL